MKMALVQQQAIRRREENLIRAVKALEEATSQGARLITYPELSFNFFLLQYPYTSECLDLAEPITGPTTRVRALWQLLRVK